MVERGTDGGHEATDEAGVLAVQRPRLGDDSLAVHPAQLVRESPELGEGGGILVGKPVGVGEGLPRRGVAGKELGGTGRGLECAACIAGAGQRLRQSHLRSTVGRLEPDGAAGRLDPHRRLRGVDPLTCLGNGPGRLARIVAREAAEFGRGIAVGALLGQDAGKELAVADLVGIEPHGILCVALGLVQATKGQQGAGAVLVGRVVPGALGKDRIGLSQHEVVIASLEGCGHIVQTDRGH